MRSLAVEAVARLGLSPEELVVIELLAEAVNAFAALPQQHPSEMDEFVLSTHAPQQIVMARLAARAHPDVFLNYKDSR